MIKLVLVADLPAKEKRPEFSDRPNSVFCPKAADSPNKQGRSSKTFRIRIDFGNGLTTCLGETLHQPGIATLVVLKLSGEDAIRTAGEDA